LSAEELGSGVEEDGKFNVGWQLGRQGTVEAGAARNERASSPAGRRKGPGLNRSYA